MTAQGIVAGAVMANVNRRRAAARLPRKLKSALCAASLNAHVTCHAPDLRYKLSFETAGSVKGPDILSVFQAIDQAGQRGARW